MHERNQGSLTMTGEHLNPSKRLQEDEKDILIWDMKKELKHYQELYEEEHMKTFFWHNEELEMRRKKNEWAMLSILLITILVLLKVIRVI
jgi:intein-encoded DNA endonuclease-like protein